MAANREYIQGTVYREVGGAREVVSSGASLDVESGAELDIESGGALKLAGTAIAATAAEINQAADNSANVEVVTATNEIAASESGSTFFLNNATGFVSTLPAAAAGLRFTFIVSAAVTTTGGHTIVCPAAAALFKGQVVTCDFSGTTDSDFGTTGEATITFVINKAVAGDRVDVICDGTHWFFRGFCSVFDAITVA